MKAFGHNGDNWINKDIVLQKRTLTFEDKQKEVIFVSILDAIEDSHESLFFFLKQMQENCRMIRTYRMTVASVWYDEDVHKTREYEMHFKVARLGDIREEPHLLSSKRGAGYFQNRIYYLDKHWISLSRIRVSFEREEPAREIDEWIRIEIRHMQGVGKQRQWKAYGELPRKIRYYRPKNSDCEEWMCSKWTKTVL